MAKKIRKKDNDYTNQEIRKSIYLILLVVFGIISVLALFNQAGIIGKGWAYILTKLFGWGDFLVPIILFALGWSIYRSFSPERFKEVNYLEILLLLLSGFGILHWTQAPDNMISAIADGKGGGIFGLILALPLYTVLGKIGSLVVLVAIFLISIIVIFNVSINKIVVDNWIYKLFVKIKNQIIFLKYRYFLKDNNGSESEEKHEDVEDIKKSDYYEKEDEYEETRENEEVQRENKVQEEIEVFKTNKPLRKKIKIPIGILGTDDRKPNSGDIKANQQIIKKTLANFGIEVEMGEVNVGPTITQYTLKPAQGVKLTQITTLHNDLALALAAHPIRIEAPIPGKSLVGIEVPNKSVAIVSLKDLLSSSEFKNRKSNLSIPLGKTVSGEPFITSLDDMPHLLIAGATGSGKSIAINSMIISLMYQNQPSELKFILIDPKKVELSLYRDIPYLLTPVITENKKTVGALKWAVNEMERRYTILSHKGLRHISEYNEIVDEDEKLPYIIVIIDELAELMTVMANEVENLIVRIAQKARAVGIHLVVATQRPSVDIITGLIKANIPARAAFSVASVVDSRTIIDTAGAEKLLGKGDMLYVHPDLSKPKRLQGAYVSNRDVKSVTAYVKSQGLPEYRDDIELQVQYEYEGSSDWSEDEELIEKAKEIILQAGRASATLLQRRLGVGYPRAARIIDILEEEGFVGPPEGSKPREILVSKEEYYSKNSQELEEDTERNEETEE